MNKRLTNIIMELTQYTAERVSMLGSEEPNSITIAELEQLKKISTLADGTALILNRERTMLS